MVRVTKLKRRAIVLLFLDGYPPKAVARVFRLQKADIEEVLRRHARSMRRR